MSSEWKTYCWGDIATLEYGRNCPNYANNIGDYPVFGTNGQIGKYQKFLCGHPGIIIGRKGAYRGVHYSDKPFWVIDTAFYVEPKINIDIKWAYYHLLTQDINRMDSGSAIPSTSRQDFYSLTVILPPLQEQKQIASVLSCLDAKIDNLRRQNETLEKIAQLLFKRWFIDFEFPNDDGKPYNSSGGEMVASELGEIPVGWRVGKLGDVAKNIRLSIKETDILSDTPYIGLEHIPRKSIALDNWGTSEDLSSNKFSFQKGQILFGKLRPYFHKVGVAFISGICSTDILVLDSKNDDYFSFVLMTVSSVSFIKYVTNASEGTRMPRTNWKYMSDFNIVISERKIAENFNQIIKNFIKKIENNINQIQTLTKTRDLLLPKLMSGEIRIEEGEEEK